jgi:hypothetical protein
VAKIANAGKEQHIVDWWNHMSSRLRQRLRGWNRNNKKMVRVQKEILIKQFQELDAKWALRRKIGLFGFTWNTSW